MKDPEVEVVDTTAQIVRLIDSIAAPRPSSPILYIDLEGVKLSRHGSISILTLLVDCDNTQRVYLVDVHALNAFAFSTAGITNKTLKHILESQQIIKVFFDVRNDSDALFAHFGIALKGVEDVQVMESATRKTTASRRLLNGLARCIEDNLSHFSNRQELARWKLTKTNGERLFKPELGGSYDVFNRRPIPEELIGYCVGDVKYLADLRNFFLAQIHNSRHLVDEESRARVAASQKPAYQPHGQHKALAPWTKEQNGFLDRINSPHVSCSRRDALDFDDDFDDLDSFDNEEPDYDWWDDGPTSCRDIINDSDMHYYYSD
jgi:exonuclease 3'-5' domain-containing protein 1